MGSILTSAYSALQSAQVAYDNRAEPEIDEDAADVDAACDDAIALIGRATRALITDKAAAADLLREAAKLLGDIAEEVEA
jgi:hypothetical protein